MINFETPTSVLRDAALHAIDFAREVPLSSAQCYLAAESWQHRDEAFRCLHAVESALRRAAHAAATLSVRQLVAARFPEAHGLQLRQLEADPYYGFEPVALVDGAGTLLWDAPSGDVWKVESDQWPDYLRTACANLTDADGVLDDPARSPMLRFTAEQAG